MPTAAPKPCTQCGKLVRDGSSRCEAHKTRVGSFADKSRGTRQARGYGAEWTKLRELVLRRDGGLCQVCLAAGNITSAREVDHVTPKAEGGTEDLANLQAICKPCHQAKTAKEAARGIGAAGPFRKDRA